MTSRITQSINWGDLLRATMHLSPAAFGAYMRLIGHYWDHKGLPEDAPSLQRITGVDNRNWDRMRPTLQAFFHDGWRHKRIDEDLAKSDEYRAAQKRKIEQRWAVDKSAEVTGTGRKSPAPPKSLKSNGTGHTAVIPSLFLNRESSSKKEALPPSRRQARQNWEADLARQLGDDIGDVLDRLANNPRLCERATAAEQRKPGAGAQAIMIGLQRHSRAQR